MAMRVEPYLVFGGRCEEAIEFYRGALGAQVENLLRWKECPDAKPGSIPPGVENKVMHASFRVGDTLIMATDGMSQGPPAALQGFSLAITVPSDAEAKRRFDLLAESGHVQQPLTPTFFTSSFGMLTDRFGVSWMIVVEAEARR